MRVGSFLALNSLADPSLPAAIGVEHEITL
jgi:hypothetical protein